MDLSALKDMAELAAALAIPVAGILHSLYSWRKTGEINLDKTLKAAGDVVHIVADRITAADGKDVDKHILTGVAEVESLRGHAISKTLKRKAAAHIEAKLRARHPGLFVDAE